MLVFKAKNYIYIQLLFFFIGLLLANDFVWTTNKQKRLQWLMSRKLLRDRDNFFCFVWWKLCEENGNSDNEDLSNNNKILWESWLKIFKPKRVLDYNTLSEITTKNGRITSPYFLSANDGWMCKQKYVSKQKFSKRTVLHNRVRERRQTNKTFKNLQSGKFPNNLNEKYKVIARKCFEKISTLPLILSNGIDNIESSGASQKKTMLKCIRNCLHNKKGTNFAYNCFKTIFDRKTLNYSQLIEQNDELKIPSFSFNLSSIEHAILKLRSNPNPVFHPFSFHKYFANNLLSHKTVSKFRGRRLLGFLSNDFLDIHGNNQLNTQDGTASFQNDIFNRMIQNNKNASITNETNFNFQSHLESRKNEFDTNASVLSPTNADILSFLKPSITLRISQFFQKYKPETLDALNSGNRYLQKSVGYTSEMSQHLNDLTTNLRDDIKPTPVQRIYKNSNDYSFRNSKKLFQHNNSIEHVLNLKDEISVIQSLDKLHSLIHLTSDITQMTQLSNYNGSSQTTFVEKASHQFVQRSIVSHIGLQHSQKEAKIASEYFDYSMQSGDRLVSVINLTSGVNQMTQLTNDNDSFKTTSVGATSHQIVQSSIVSLIGSQHSQNAFEMESGIFDYSMQSGDRLVSVINLTSDINQMTQLTNDNDSFKTTSVGTTSHQIVQSSIASLIGSQHSQNVFEMESGIFDYSTQSGDRLVSVINLTSDINQMTQLTNDNDSFKITSVGTTSHQIVQSSIASLIGSQHSQNVFEMESGIFDYSMQSGDRLVSVINLTSDINQMTQLTSDNDSFKTTSVEATSHQIVQSSIASLIGSQHSQNAFEMESGIFDYSMQSGDRLVSVINLTSDMNQMIQLTNDNDSFEITSAETASPYLAQHLISTVSHTDLQHSHNVAKIESDIFDKDNNTTIQPYQTMKYKWKSHLISSSFAKKNLSVLRRNYFEKLYSTPTLKLNSFTSFNNSSTLKSSFTLKVNLTLYNDLKYRVTPSTVHSLRVPGTVLYKSRKDKIHEIYSKSYSVLDEHYYFATSRDIVGSVETFRANDEKNDSRLKIINSVLLHETRSKQTDRVLNEKTTDFNLNSVINTVSHGKGISKLLETLTQNTFSSDENRHSNIVNLSGHISGNENQNTTVKIYSDKYPDMNFSRVRDDFNGTNQDNINFNELNSNSTDGFLISTVSMSFDEIMSTKTDFVKVLSTFQNNHTESVKGNSPHGSKFNEERISPDPIYQTHSMSTALDVFSTDGLKVNFDKNNNLILSESRSSSIDVYLKSSLNFKQNNGVENNFYATEELNQMLQTFTTVPTEFNTQIFPTQHLELSRSPYAVYQGKTMGAFSKEMKSLNKLKTQQVSVQTQLTEINHDNKRQKPSSTYVKEILKQISRSNHVTNVLKSIEASGGIDFGMDAGIKIKSSTNKNIIPHLSTFDNYEKFSNNPNTEQFSSVYVTTTEEVQKNSQEIQDERRTSTPYNNNVAFTEYNLTLKTNSAAEGNIVRSRNDVDDKVIGNINSNNKANNNLDNSVKSLFQQKNESLEWKFIADENNYVIKRNDGSDSTTELELLEITEKGNENTSLSKNGIFLTPDSEENALIRTEREILSPEEEFDIKPSSGKEKIENVITPLHNVKEDLKNVTKPFTNPKLPSIDIENINDTNSYFNATDNSEGTGITYPLLEENYDSKNKTLLLIKENSKSSNDEDFNEKSPFFNISINDDRDRDLEKYLTSNLNASLRLQLGNLKKQIDREWKNMSYKEGKSNVIPSATNVQVKNLSRLPASSIDILIKAEIRKQSSNEENLTDSFSDIYEQVTKSKDSNVQRKPKDFTITKLNRTEFHSNMPSSTYISHNDSVEPNFDQINEIRINPNIASKFEKNNLNVNSYINGGYHNKAISFTTVGFTEQYNPFEKETESITYRSMYELLTNSEFEIKRNKIFHDANSETESSEKLSLDIDDNISTPELIKPTQILPFSQLSDFELIDKSSLKSALINENSSILKLVNTKFITTIELATTKVSDSFGQRAHGFSGVEEILNDSDFKIKPVRTSHYVSSKTKSLGNTLFDGNDDIPTLGLVEPNLFLTPTQRLSSSLVDKFLPTPIEGTKTNDKESLGIKSVFTKFITPSRRTVDISDASENLIPIADLLIRNERETESSNEEVLTEIFFNFDSMPVNKIASSRDLDKQLENENNLVYNDLSKFSQTLLLSSLLFPYPSSNNLNSTISVGHKINLSDIEIKANASTKLGSDGLEINFTINGNIHTDDNKQTLLTTPKSSSKSDNASGSVNEIITNKNVDKNIPSNDFSPGRNEIDETKYKKELSENPLMNIDDENFNPDDIRIGENDKTSYTTPISLIEHDFTLGWRDEISTEKITNDKIPGKNAISGENKNERSEVHQEESHGNQPKIEVDNESFDTELVSFDDVITEKNPMLLSTPKSYIESDDALERGDTVDSDEIVKVVLSDNDFPIEKYNNTREKKNKRESQNNPTINVNDKKLSIESVKSDDVNIDQNNQILSTTSRSFITSDDALRNRDINTADKLLKEIIPDNDFFSTSREKIALDSNEELTSLKNPLLKDDQSISLLFLKPTTVTIFPEKLSSTTINSLLLMETIKKVKNIDETYTTVPVFTKHSITSQTTTEIDDVSRNLISSDDVIKNSIAFDGGSRNSVLTDDVLIRTERETQSSNEEILTEPILNADDIFDVPDLRNPKVQPKEENVLTTNSFSKIPLPEFGSNLPLPENTSNDRSFGREININGMGTRVNASTKMGSGNLDVNFNIDDASNKDGIPEMSVTTPKLSVEIDSILGDGGVVTTDKNSVETFPDTNILSKVNKLPRDLKDEQGSLEITTGNIGDKILNPNLIQPTPVFNLDISSVDLSQFFPHLPIKTSTINYETSPKKSVFTESVEDEEVYSDSTPEVISKDITNENKISTQKDIETFSEPSSLLDDVESVDDSIRTSTTSTSTVVGTESSIIPFHFTIDADYKEVVGTRKKEFEESLAKQLGVAMRVPIECVQNLTVTKGSIQVDFNLVPSPDHGHMSDEKAMKAAADELKRMIDNGLLNINDLDGSTLVVVPLDPPTMSPPASEMEHTTLILGVIIGAFILTIIAVVISAIVIKRKSNGISRLSPIEEARSKMPSYRDIPFQEALFMKNTLHNKLMLGKYNYDTGKWVGPGPEPKAFRAPDSVVYRPPTDSEIRRTPRPPTAVRERLRNDWELDWDSTVFSR